MTPNAELLSVALFTGLNGLVLFWLAWSVGKVRQREKISIGDGGNQAMIRVMRGQANFIETVPFCLMILLLMALIGTPAWVILIFGIMLTFGRVIHAWHFIKPDGERWERMWGTILTILVLVPGSLGLIGHAIWGLL